MTVNLDRDILPAADDKMFRLSKGLFLGMHLLIRHTLLMAMYFVQQGLLKFASLTMIKKPS